VALLLLLTTLLLSLLLTGCGGKDTIAGETPQATAEAFVEAMKAGEYDRVAAGFEFETYARANQENWDDIPVGQRNEIIGRLREDQSNRLRGLAGMFMGEASVGEVQQQADSATATITAGANTLVLGMKQVEGRWLISSMAEVTG